MRSARLDFAPFAAGDAPELLRMFRDADMRRYLLDDMLVDAAWLGNQIEASSARFAAGDIGLWSLRERGQDPIIGFTGFLPMLGTIQLIYGLLPPWWGHGLASEAATAALEAWRALGHGEAVAATDPPNLASQRTLMRLGFVETARDAATITYRKTL